ncbi:MULTISPECIES: DUF1871 family protein [unclassified Paenibacillus]|uniref:DUF1871 family protein n=1 Tax=unclassified Paenibacillus TaxID=185978 RepID=UPI0004F5AABA|nr:DUF1871 family protein [Paenibacillus sp. FSL H7-0737]AIQ22636.1 hypothetical protein H70737_07075 [Paenibacillus sp. FSL H7-0737]
MEKVMDIINKWNPIEIYPLLEDEYQSESKQIMIADINSESAETLAKEIFNVFNESFGKKFKKSLKECEVIAEEILRCKLES